MFKLEPSFVAPTPIDITDTFVETLREAGIRVELVHPTYKTQNLDGPVLHEISSKRVKDVDHILDELIKINPYVVFVREITEYTNNTTGASEFTVRFDFIAPLDR